MLVIQLRNKNPLSYIISGVSGGRVTAKSSFRAVDYPAASHHLEKLNFTSLCNNQQLYMSTPLVDESCWHDEL